MKIKNEGEQLISELDQMKNSRRKQAFLQSSPVLIAKGAWVFAEGTSLLVTSIYALYQAHYGHDARLYRDVLTVAGVLVLMPAAHLLSKFFRSVGEIK